MGFATEPSLRTEKKEKREKSGDWRRTLAKFDAFEFRQQKSACGATTTIIFIGVFCLYLAYTIADFANKRNCIAIQSRLLAPAELELVLPDFGVLVQAPVWDEETESYETQHVHDETYFYWTFRQRYYGNEGRKPHVDLGNVACNFPLAGNNLQVNTRCPEPSSLANNGTVLGSFEKDHFYFVEMALNRCWGTAPDGRPCKSQEEIDHMVLNTDTRVNFLTVVNDREQLQPYTLYYKMGLADTYQTVDIFFTERVVRTASRGRPLISDKEEKFVIVENNVNYMETRKMRETEGPLVYTKLYARIAQETISDEIHCPTFLDLCMSWGGLRAFLFLSLGLAAKFYNQRLFRVSLAIAHSSQFANVIQKQTTVGKEPQAKYTSSNGVESSPNEKQPKEANVEMRRVIQRSFLTHVRNRKLQHTVDALRQDAHDTQDLVATIASLQREVAMLKLALGDSANRTGTISPAVRASLTIDATQAHQLPSTSPATSTSRPHRGSSPTLPHPGSPLLKPKPSAAGTVYRYVDTDGPDWTRYQRFVQCCVDVKKSLGSQQLREVQVDQLYKEAQDADVGETHWVTWLRATLLRT